MTSTDGDGVREWAAPPNKGMNLTRVGAGARRVRRGEVSSWIAAQVMPGVLRTVAKAKQGPVA